MGGVLSTLERGEELSLTGGPLPTEYVTRNPLNQLFTAGDKMQEHRYSTGKTKRGWNIQNIPGFYNFCDH